MTAHGAVKLRIGDLRIVAATEQGATGWHSGYAILTAADVELGFFTSYAAAIRAVLGHRDGPARLDSAGKP